MPPRERVQHRHAIDASPNAGGPASKGNFTTFDDDGWWDDDENYWDDDYDCFWPCGITFDGAFLDAIDTTRLTG